MAQLTCIFLSLCILIIDLSVCSSAKLMDPFEEASSLEENAHTEQKILSPHRQLLFVNFKHKTVEHDVIYPPITTSPTTPATFLPASNPPPTIVTIPSTNPIILTPNPDNTPAVTFPSIDSPLPITNPVTTPSITTPVTNPVTTYPAPTIGVPATTPVTIPVAPPTTVGSVAAPGQSWCVARSDVSEAAIQAALDYACGMGGADCSAIQQGASCEIPDSLQNHASYAFNSYYQKNPIQASCDFGGTGMITATNPSTGTCVYPTSSRQTSTPLSATTPSPTTTASGGGLVPGFVTPPSLLNSSNPTSVDGIPDFGETPSSFNSSTSMCINFQLLIGFLILAACTVGGRIIVDL